MNAIEMDKALRRLRLSGMAEALEPRLLEARASKLSHIDFLSALVSDELQRRGDRLIARRITQARFRHWTCAKAQADYGRPARVGPRQSRQSRWRRGPAVVVPGRHDDDIRFFQGAQALAGRDFKASGGAHRTFFCCAYRHLVQMLGMRAAEYQARHGQVERSDAVEGNNGHFFTHGPIISHVVSWATIAKSVRTAQWIPSTTQTEEIPCHAAP